MKIWVVCYTAMDDCTVAICIARDSAPKAGIEKEENIKPHGIVNRTS